MGRKLEKVVPSGELLVILANLLNAVGPDDARVDAFLEKHKADEEFVSLAQAARAGVRTMILRC